MKLQRFAWPALVWVGLLGTLLLCTPLTWADSSAGGRPGPVPSGNASWNDPTNPMCRQGCTYDKANETISIQLQYAQNKLQAAKDLAAAQEWDRVLSTLGEFCLQSEQGGGESEAKECLDRYERYEVLALQKMRRSIIGNEDSHAKLLSQQVTIGGAVERGTALPNTQYAMRENEAPRRPIVSHLPSFNELQELDRTEGARMRASVTDQFTRWLAEYPREPDKNDFVKTRRVRRDPSNPASGYFTVIDTNPDGSPKYDMQAYSNAMRVYQQEISNLQADANAYRGTEERMRNASLRRQRTRLGNGQVDTDSRSAFNDARGVFVDAANRSIQGQQQTQARPPGSPVNGGRPQARPTPGAPPVPANSTASSHVPSTGSVTARTPAANAPRYDGNNPVIQPPPTVQNQFNTNSVTIDTQELRNNFNDVLLQEINGVDIPALTDP